MTRLPAAALALTTLAVSSSAFTPAATNTRHINVAYTSSSSSPRSNNYYHAPTTFLRMSEEENNVVEEQSSVEAELTEESPETAEAEEEEPAEDPEVTELKATISTLESTLKSKRSELTSLRDMADKYSPSGYARQVALVENNKRMRGANMADSKSAARASVLQSFLPALEEMEAIGAKYDGIDFARTLQSGLTLEFENNLKELGVTEYGVESGEEMIMGRVVAVTEEYSEEVAKGSVITPLRGGLEIEGNVVRPAECVASLGSESAQAEEEEAEGVEESNEEGAAAE